MSKLGLDLIAATFWDIDRTEARESRRTQPSCAGYRTDRLGDFGIPQRFPYFDNDLGRKNLVGSRMQEDAREQAAEGFPKGGILRICCYGSGKTAGQYVSRFDRQGLECACEKGDLC